MLSVVRQRTSTLLLALAFVGQLPEGYYYFIHFLIRANQGPIQGQFRYYISHLASDSQSEASTPSYLISPLLIAQVKNVDVNKERNQCQYVQPCSAFYKEPPVI